MPEIVEQVFGKAYLSGTDRVRYRTRLDTCLNRCQSGTKDLGKPYL
jgi:hypothetical protein